MHPRSVSLEEPPHAVEAAFGRRVVRYARGSSAREPATRSMEELEGDLDFILREVSARAERGELEDACALAQARAFVDDRMRAIRRDLARAKAERAEGGVERCARALERTCAHDVTRERAMRRESGYDASAATLRDEQLAKTFGMLLGCYDELGMPERGMRGEAYASLFLCARVREEDGARGRLAVDLRRLKLGASSLGMRIVRALTCGNHVEFFRLVESPECSYEHACELERHFAVVRIEALRAMNAAMNSTPMSLDELARILRLDSAGDAATMAKMCKLAVDDEDETVSFRTSAFAHPNLRDTDVAAALRAIPSSFVDAKRAHALEVESAPVSAE